MRTAKIYRYQLPLIYSQKQGEENIKTGFFVELINEQNCGIGEIAPLSGFSFENIEESFAQLKTTAQNWCQNAHIEYSKLFPSVAFGFSMAITELTGFFKNIVTPATNTGAKLFNCQAQLIETIKEDPKIGLIKLKIANNSPKFDAQIINRVCEQNPLLKIRLDGNCKWTSEQALSFSKCLSTKSLSAIEFIEEPTYDIEENLHFSNYCSLPLAVDESLQLAIREKNHQKLIENKNIAVFVIKPSLIGSLDSIKQIIYLINNQNKKVVISSAMESSFTLIRLAKIAKILTPQTPYGLDTAKFYQYHLLEAFDNENLQLPISDLSDCELIWESV